MFIDIQQEKFSSQHKLEKIDHVKLVERHVAIQRFCGEENSNTTVSQNMVQ